MTESFERQVRSYKLWTWLYAQLLSDEVVNQNDIVEYAEKNNLGSKKSILSILSDFLTSKLIQEIELPANGVGRPKKGYSKYKEKSIDLTLLNMADLPPAVLDFVYSESKQDNILPTDVIIKLVSWAYNYLVSAQYSDSKPVFELPEHLKINSDPLTRLVDK